MRLSFRDKKAHQQGMPYVPVSAYPSNPANPWASQEANEQLGINDNHEYFCPKCKSVNLLSDSNPENLICPKCNSRYSKRQFNVGGILSRETGLLDSTSGGNAAPDYHYDTEYGGGSASTEWGRSQ